LLLIYDTTLVFIELFCAVRALPATTFFKAAEGADFPKLYPDPVGVAGHGQN